jgi:acyl-coenzyme A thioesterase PaaI-like protein
MQVGTHEGIDRRLCGEPVSLGDGEATVRLATTAEMAVDARGLVHGGFVFGAADHAAMLAVNHPLVVLGASETRFLAPVAVGEVVTCVARALGEPGRKRVVEVTASVDGKPVLTGTFTTFTLDRHVLDGRST